MRIKNALVLYKHSAYENYFLKRGSSFRRQPRDFNPKDVSPFKSAHSEHYKTLSFIEDILRKKMVPYRKHARSSKIDFDRFDFVITVGGDGTFLEAARNVKGQAILGVNSDPKSSVGRFCFGNVSNFTALLERYLHGTAPSRWLQKILLKFLKQKVSACVTNDLLICHSNPAAMSRYQITVKGVEEIQHSSGVWVATAAGSSGAIKSAGGQALLFTSRKFQYQPRELYEKKGGGYRLKGGILSPGQTIRVKSLMRNGVIFIDGSHVRFPFHFGEVAEMTASKNFLEIIHG